MSAYYNEHDQFAAVWLRELIADGQITDGIVDERNIQEVQYGDLQGFDRCHFFAGIGGWDRALMLAGWSGSIWTGSCPCQPFSTAGQGAAGADARHLWPHWFRLIRECRPERVFGEQVAAAIGHGWLDLVSTEMEQEGYAVGAVVLGAHSVGAPHLRQRLWFVAESEGEQSHRSGTATDGGELADTLRTGLEGLAGDGRDWDEPGRLGTDEARPVAATGASVFVADADGRNRQHGDLQRIGQHRLRAQGGRVDGYKREPERSEGAWDDLLWIPCRDGKARPTQSGLQPLAHGVSARVGRLRGYGNAIVPQVAAEVIRAYMGDI